MAITVNGRILRNLPEQVSKNTEDIIDLQEQSNNQEIRITALEGNAIALATFHDCTFTGTSSFTGPLNSSDGFTFGNDGYVGGDLSVGRDLSVAGSATLSGPVTAFGNLAVVGNITGGSIIENMSGYDATIGSDENLSISPIYAGIVKNGNKLTLVFAASLTRIGDLTANPKLVEFDIPSIIGAKLLPWSFSYLDNKVVKAWRSATSNQDVESFIYKDSNTKIRINSNYSSINSLTLNVAYYFRYEATFLLSENLLP